MTQHGFAFDQGAERVAGVDEVGRGPLAGDVVAAAVILDPNQPIAGLTDSKALTARKRERLSEEIKARALSWCIARASVAEIDDLNILQASLLAMRRAVKGLNPPPDFCQVDGNRIPEALPCAAEAVIKGDLLIPAIGAASILAKVQRDAEMHALDQCHPQFGFARHKGYPTAEHLAAIRTHGIIAEHRRSYGPIQRWLATQVNQPIDHQE